MALDQSKSKTIRFELEPILNSYDAPICKKCKTIQKITSIEINHASKKLDDAEIIITLRCESAACQPVLKQQIFKLYNPDTHEIQKLPKEKRGLYSLKKKREEEKRLKELREHKRELIKQKQKQKSEKK